MEIGVSFIQILYNFIISILPVDRKLIGSQIIQSLLYSNISLNKNASYSKRYLNHRRLWIIWTQSIFYPMNHILILKFKVFPITYFHMKFETTYFSWISRRFIFLSDPQDENIFLWFWVSIYLQIEFNVLYVSINSPLIIYSSFNKFI